MPTTRAKTAAAPRPVITTASPLVMPGDEAPDPAEFTAAVIADPRDDPRVLDLMDPRTAALHDLMQPPAIVVSDKAPPPDLPAGLFRPVPAPTGERHDWDPTGSWFLVCCTYYDRSIDGKLCQSRIGDQVQIPHEDRAAQDVELQYIVPELPAGDLPPEE